MGNSMCDSKWCFSSFLYFKYRVADEVLLKCEGCGKTFCSACFDNTDCGSDKSNKHYLGLCQKVIDGNDDKSKSSSSNESILFKRKDFGLGGKIKVTKCENLLFERNLPCLNCKERCCDLHTHTDSGYCTDCYEFRDEFMGIGSLLAGSINQSVQNSNSNGDTSFEDQTPSKNDNDRQKPQPFIKVFSDEDFELRTYRERKLKRERRKRERRKEEEKK